MTTTSIEKYAMKYGKPIIVRPADHWGLGTGWAYLPIRARETWGDMETFALNEIPARTYKTLNELFEAVKTDTTLL